ncbi:MAG TPA: cytochrome c3 family protein, partial [Tepidisphaeraceae bacterium]|nr:cytochrome c3 family protein [Tepidisphaeraceae bacterium]
EIYVSPWSTGVNRFVQQPVPFSHEHHVGGLGIECRYCHTSVETSSSAGIPPTHTCMTCHSKIWLNAPILEPVRNSWATGVPLHWNRVYNLPQFVHFNHAIHVNKGIGCSTCHGRVDQMPLMQQVNPMVMQWCLDCHRQPEQFIRPRGEVFNMQWQPPPDQLTQGAKLVKEYNVNKRQLINCSVCHY